MNLKLDVQTFPVTLWKDNKKHNYELREMTAAVRDAHMDAVRARTTMDKEGNVSSINKFEGLQADLLRRCLWDLGDDEKPIPAVLVKTEEIQQWPSSVVAQLYAKAQELQKAGEDEIKNE